MEKHISISLKDIYTYCYRLLEDVTPLPVDCGALCEAACCQSSGDEEMGMYLFPGEEVMYSKCPPNFRIEPSHFVYDDEHALQILFCEPPCDRKMRPLSCRIFPLFPYISPTGELNVISDPRSKGVCPLSQALSVDELDPRFVKRVTKVFRLLSKIPAVQNAMTALSETFVL